jgi:hypothetical protein
MFVTGDLASSDTKSIGSELGFVIIVRLYVVTEVKFYIEHVTKKEKLCGP